jgi:TRAP-type C4-dicarboxylate transport system permease small subunit
MSSVVEAEIAAHLGEDKEPLLPEPRFVLAVRKVDRALARVEEVLLSVCLATLLLIGVLGALKRNFAPPSPFWIDEVIRYAVFFIGLTGAALAAQADRLFNIDMFTRVMKPRARLVMHVVQAVFVIVVCYFIFRGSLVLFASLRDERGELIPPAAASLSLPIAMTLISVHQGLHIVADLYYLVTGTEPPAVALPKSSH